MTHPDNESLDTFINIELARIPWSDLEKPDYEFYQYEADIEKREPHLIIPLNQNEIYKTVKDYCLVHGLSDVLYHMIEYPDEVYDNLLYFTEMGTDKSFLFDILPEDTTEQDITNAFHWTEEE